MFKKKEEVPKKTLLEKMQETKDKNGIAFICVYNDRKARIEDTNMTAFIKYANDPDAFDDIGKAMFNINETYARDYDYDTLNVKLSLGLVFSGKDMDRDKKVKPNAEPIEGIVHYITGDATSYLNGEKTNEVDWGYVKSRTGYIRYDILVNSAEENGLVFNGPRTFEEFKEHILVGEPFDISLTASLHPKEKETQYTKTK